MKYFALFLFILIVQTSSAQIIECGFGWSKRYRITAESGLRLRSGPGLEHTAVGLIPFGATISGCNNRKNREEIDSIKGNWIWTHWQGREGYIFDGYAEVVEDFPQIKLLIPEVNSKGELMIYGASADETYYGLYQIESSDEFELRKIEGKELRNFSREFLAASTEELLWLFTGLEIDVEASKKIKGRLLYKMIYIGEKLPLDHRTILYGYGKIEKQDTLPYGALYLNPYELRVNRAEESGKVLDQLLIRMTCFGGTSFRFGYDAKPTINFIGDLDGDEKDDILLTHQNTYKGWYYVLFSTRYAKAGQLFATISVGGGSE